MYKDLLYTCVVPFDDEQPDGKGAQWDGNIPAHMKQFQRRRDAGEVRHDVGQVRDHQDGHHDEGGAQTELLADEVRQPFSCHRTHAGTHFLGHDEQQCDWEQGPEWQVAIFGSGL
jgi:hypothetical protein